MLIRAYDSLVLAGVNYEYDDYHLLSSKLVACMIESSFIWGSDK